MSQIISLYIYLFGCSNKFNILEKPNNYFLHKDHLNYPTFQYINFDLQFFSTTYFLEKIGINYMNKF
jgi:hypothetical protein